jgi:tRNA pseudouridine13 synthase
MDHFSRILALEIPMRHKFRPKDFAVEERMQLRLASQGAFAVYRLRKRGVAALRVRAQIARALNVPQSDVIFPALKDKDAITVQHIAVRGDGPPRLTGDGFEAEFLGRSQRPLTPADIVANRFTIVLRDLSDDEVREIPERLDQVAESGLPNYFDRQRFGSVVPGEEHIARRILRRDAEGALRAYLTQPFVGDPARVRQFKAFARGHWGDWDALFEAAPRPSNYRSVLTYLCDHPVAVSAGPEPSQGEGRAIHYRKALNLINRRLLSIYLSAYQSLLWNRAVGRYLEARLGQPPGYVEIAGERLPVYHTLLSLLGTDVAVPLPSHRAGYDDLALDEIVAQVLAEEGLALSDLKARILKHAYLPKGKRTLTLLPLDSSASYPEPDEYFPGQNKLTLIFTLPRGSYATLVIRMLLV